jgi:hypothetical protein
VDTPLTLCTAIRIEPVFGEIDGAFTTKATLNALVDDVGRGEGCVGTSDVLVPPPPPPHALTLTVTAANTAAFWYEFIFIDA